MKKLLCILLLLSSSTTFIHSYPQVQSEDELTRLAAEYEMDDLPDLIQADATFEEYDAEICDEKEIQKISWIEAKARAIGVALLFRLIAVRDYVKNKLQTLKDYFKKQNETQI